MEVILMNTVKSGVSLKSSSKRGTVMFEVRDTRNEPDRPLPDSTIPTCRERGMFLCAYTALTKA